MLTEIIDLIDQANSQDPNTVIDLDGKVIAKELLYSQRMSTALSQFLPDASETLQIAARAQHIERWKSPRSDYPVGLAGYRKWRTQLKIFHANQTAALMQRVGYSEDSIHTVKTLLQKHQLKINQQTQALEDVICLVFLRYYLVDFAAKHEESRLIDIIQKTWRKMSEKGHTHAMQINFSEPIKVLLEKALHEKG